MPAKVSPHPSWLARAGRLALAAAGLSLAALTGLHHADLARERRDLSHWLGPTGATVGEEPERQLLRLKAVRAALTAELQPRRFEGHEARVVARRQGAVRLARAADLAGSVLAARPASWEAAMGLGASTYLSWSLAQDPRLFTEYHRWEAPLTAARELGPGKREPLRFLAAAYLEIWPSLSPAKKARTIALLSQVFGDEQGQRLLLEPWVDIAADRAAVFSSLPADPSAWGALLDVYMKRHDWEEWAEARRRWDRVLLARLESDLESAADLEAAGDPSHARMIYLSAAARARNDRRYLGVVTAALSRCPPGTTPGYIAQALRPVLEAELDRCLLGRCGMKPDTLARLALLVGELDPPQAAMAALVSGARARAFDFERHAPNLWSEEWAPYLVLKAREAAKSGDIEAGQEALDGTHSSWRHRLAYLGAAVDLGRAASNSAARDAAQGQLRAHAATAWATADWLSRDRGTARLEMVTEVNARGLRLTLDDVPPAGAVIELRFDGTVVGSFPVARSAAAGEGNQAAVLDLRLTVPGGLHVLELETPVGGRVLPGAVALLP